MTESEIIKALEHCTSIATSGACNGCPLNTKDGCNSLTYTYNLLEKLALDLINRKNAEIEKSKHYKSLYEELKAEHIETIKAIAENIATERSEAIKEFVAELLEKYCFHNSEGEGIVFDTDIYNLAKEMGVEL